MKGLIVRFGILMRHIRLGLAEQVRLSIRVYVCTLHTQRIADNHSENSLVTSVHKSYTQSPCTVFRALRLNSDNIRIPKSPAVQWSV